MARRARPLRGLVTRRRSRGAWRHHPCSQGAAGLLALVGLSLAPPGSAAVYQALADTETEYDNDPDMDGYASADHLTHEESALGIATAQAGSVGAFAGAVVDVAESFASAQTQTDARASMAIGGVYISGPCCSISTSYNLQVKGTLSIECQDVWPRHAGGNASFQIDSRVSGPPPQQASLALSGWVSKPEINCTGTSYSGVFAGPGFDGDEVVTSTVDVMPTGVEQTLYVSVSTQAIAAASAGDPPMTLRGEARADFRYTVSFPTDRPVFNLPAGYTVNSDDGLIVDNHFVPAPTGLHAALAAGTALALLAGRRR